MALAARALALVLAVLVALTGASLDLCACAAGDHGLLCAASDDVHAPAAPVTPVEPAAHGCCGGGVEASDVTIGAADCACPVVALEAPASEPPGAAASAPDRVELGLAPPSEVDLVAAVVAAGAGHARAPPWTPPLRRHLSLHVLRL